METMFDPGSTIMSILKLEHWVDVFGLSGVNNNFEEGAALVRNSCCLFIKKRVTGILINKSNKFPSIKYLFVRIFIL